LKPFSLRLDKLPAVQLKENQWESPLSHRPRRKTHVRREV
jgi:hypothetical protein